MYHPHRSEKSNILGWQTDASLQDLPSSIEKPMSQHLPFKTEQLAWNKDCECKTWYCPSQRPSRQAVQLWDEWVHGVLGEDLAEGQSSKGL